MANIKTNEKWERFKREVLEWKNTHIDEYLDFAEKMNSGQDAGFLQLVLLLKNEAPKFFCAWENRWRDDAKDEESFDRLDEIVRQSDVLKNWLGEMEYQKTNSRPHIGPLMICWIVYGQMFETVVRRLNALCESSDVGIIQKRFILPLIIKRTIKASINSGYRTKSDWDIYFKLEKASKVDTATLEAVWEEIQSEITDESKQAMFEEAKLMLEINPPCDAKSSGRKKAKEQPLIYYLVCENKEAVIEVIRKHIIENNYGIAIALTLVALRELDIIDGITNNLEYYKSLVLQYPDITDMKSESSCMHALGDVQKTRIIYIDGKQREGRLNDDDKYRALYALLLNNLKMAINAENA